MNKNILAAASLVALSLSLTGCGSDEPDAVSPSVSASSWSSASPSTAPDPGASPSLPPDEEDLPPAPTRSDILAYVTALRLIDSDIVEESNSDSLVDRGRTQCLTIYQVTDPREVIAVANSRFSTAEHQDGFGMVKSKQINEAVKKYLCPKAWG